jgi:hypothetical protein
MLRKKQLIMMVVLGAMALMVMAFTRPADARGNRLPRQPVHVEMFTPEAGHRVGIDGKGWFVDLEVEYDTPLAQSGFTLNADEQPGFQLTGSDAPETANYVAGVHNNARPFPGAFSPGQDERIPGIIVVMPTTTIGAGACQNLANLFNMTGVTNLNEDETELWDTWIVGGPFFGVDTYAAIYVAVADDLNGDGIYNDAPDVVPDADGNGICNPHDLRTLGVASNIEQARFYINGPVDLGDVPLVP